MRHLLIVCLVVGSAHAEDTAEQELVRGQIARGEEIVGAIKDMVRHVKGIAETERKKNDIIRLSAVNDALIQLHGLANLADQALESMRRAVAEPDGSQRTHEFARLTIIHQKATVLVQQAENAVGEELAVVVGESEIETESDFLPSLCSEVDEFVGQCDMLPEMDPEAWKLYAPRFDPDHEPMRVGIALGLLVNATKWRVDSTDAPLVGLVGLPVSFRITDRWRLVAEPGLTIDRSSQNGGDQFGYAAFLEAQHLSGIVVSPLAGLHSYATSLDFKSGSYRIMEHGVHLGVALPNEIVSMVFRLLGGQETTEEGAAWVAGATLELRIGGNSRLDQLEALRKAEEEQREHSAH